MGVLSISVAAATATIGYDLLRDHRRQQVEEQRVIDTIKVTGSASAGDTEVELFIGDEYIGNFFNTATGFGNQDDVQELGNVVVFPGEKIHVYVKDAPATNPINIAISETPVS